MLRRNTAVLAVCLSMVTLCAACGDDTGPTSGIEGENNANNTGNNANNTGNNANNTGNNDNNTGNNDNSTGNNDNNTGNNDDNNDNVVNNMNLRTPNKHRSDADRCDNERSTDVPLPSEETPDDFVECRSHEECQDGANGRCTGNDRNGWRCDYDRCFEDSECGGFVCECGGGFQSDANACLSKGNCLTDADCGSDGFCSPTLGDCGFFGGVEGYFCHTPEDECIDDEDCGGGSNYCAYDANATRWVCSDSQCAG